MTNHKLIVYTFIVKMVFQQHRTKYFLFAIVGLGGTGDQNWQSQVVAAFVVGGGLVEFPGRSKLSQVASDLPPLQHRNGCLGTSRGARNPPTQDIWKSQNQNQIFFIVVFVPVML